MRKKTKEKASEHIHIRCTVKEKNHIERLAKTYADGNLSLWLVYAALNADRKFLTLNALK